MSQSFTHKIFKMTNLQNYILSQSYYTAIKSRIFFFIYTAFQGRVSIKQKRLRKRHIKIHKRKN